MRYEDELNVALTAVSKAITLCQRVKRRPQEITAIEKKDQSPVTIADFSSQAIINMVLMDAFPGDPIVGEETADVLRKDLDLQQRVLELVKHTAKTATSNQVVSAIDYAARETDYRGRFWILDPIDGTKGFLRGDQYAVALGLVEQGNVVLGVLGCPNLPISLEKPNDEIGCIVYAVKESGAWMRSFERKSDQSISVDSIVDTADAKFCESFESAHASHETHQKISSSLGMTRPPLRMDSQAKYTAIARGDASIYLRLPRKKEYQEKIWDHAAGFIVVEEAGGKVTDFRGNSLDFSAGRKLQNNNGIVATNGHLHRQVLDAIAQVID